MKDDRTFPSEHLDKESSLRKGDKGVRDKESTSGKGENCTSKLKEKGICSRFKKLPNSLW